MSGPAPSSRRDRSVLHPGLGVCLLLAGLAGSGDRALAQAPEEAAPAPAEAEAEAVPSARPAPGRVFTLEESERATLHSTLAESGTYKARIQAALLLGRRGDARHDLAALERALQEDDHYAVRGASAMAMGNLGEATAINALLEGLGDEDAFVRRACRKALGQLASPQAIPYLVLARERPEGTARMVAVELLGGLDAPDARHALAGFLGDPEPPVRDAVERALKSWPREDQVTAVLSALESDSYRVRTHAARLAGPLQDGRCLMPLAGLLSSPLETEEVIAAVDASLVEMEGLIDVDDHIKRVLGLVDREARIPSLVLLGFAGGSEAIDVLRRSAKDPDLRVRFYAVQALGRAGDTGSRVMLEAMEKDPANARIKSVIRTALRTIGS
ncbi:MAG: HEAT repeat domain-containing protein [Deltaproteobacteria bacterium]|nr:HEAT repeat domain-containing protein [Deltaproteobacteria bacterium]